MYQKPHALTGNNFKAHGMYPNDFISRKIKIRFFKNFYRLLVYVAFDVANEMEMVLPNFKIFH